MPQRVYLICCSDCRKRGVQLAFPFALKASLQTLKLSHILTLPDFKVKEKGLQCTVAIWFDFTVLSRQKINLMQGGFEAYFLLCYTHCYVMPILVSTKVIL